MFDWFDPLRELVLANVAHRHTDPDFSPPPGTLLCTPDGIFLWPGSPLLTKLGGRFVVRPRDRIYDLVCRLHGPRAAWTPILPVLECAADLLNRADIAAARICLGRLTLPPLDRAGCDLVRAIADRLGIAPLGAMIGHTDGTGLRRNLAEGLARAYDAVEPIWAVRKVDAAGDFDVNHPRLGGPPNAGWFTTSVSDGTSKPATSDKTAATVAELDTYLKHPNVRALRHDVWRRHFRGVSG